jgi:hypothetical protein
MPFWKCFRDCEISLDECELSSYHGNCSRKLNGLSQEQRQGIIRTQWTSSCPLITGRSGAAKIFRKNSLPFGLHLTAMRGGSVIPSRQARNPY